MRRSKSGYFGVSTLWRAVVRCRIILDVFFDAHR